jgi:hypothetical protein
MSFLTSDPAMWFLGLVTHFVLVLSDVSAARKKYISPWQFIKERPYKVTLSIIGAIVGYAVLQDVKDAPAYVYFSVGYMANDTLDKAGSIASRKMPQGQKPDV